MPMKHLFVTILLFVHYQAVWGQTNPGRQLLEIDSKAHRYYIDLQDAEAKVYAMATPASQMLSPPVAIKRSPLALGSVMARR